VAVVATANAARVAIVRKASAKAAHEAKVRVKAHFVARDLAVIGRVDLVLVAVTNAVDVPTEAIAVAADQVNDSKNANHCRCRKWRSLFCPTTQPLTFSADKSATRAAPILYSRSRN
jgi:hypothetical protein